MGGKLQKNSALKRVKNVKAHVYSPQSSQSTQRNLFRIKFLKMAVILRWLSAVSVLSVVKYLKFSRRKLWPIIPLPHSIVRVIKTLKPSNHSHANAPNAARSKKSFQMNLTDRIPAAAATNPSTFPNVNWKGKVKVFLHANRLRINWRIQGLICLLTGKHFILSSGRSVYWFAWAPLPVFVQS